MKRPLASIGLLSLLLTACQTPGAPGTSQSSVPTEPIMIGVLAPLTGDAAGIGSDILNGAEIAVDRINDAGGIGGRMVEIIAEDGKCTGSEAANAAQKLVNVDKVIAIVGGACSGETLAAAPIAEAGKVVLLSPTSSSPDVTDAGEYVFRNYPSDALKATAMAKYLADEKLARVAIISENTDFSQGFVASLRQKLPQGSIVFHETVEPGTKDFRTLLTRLKKVRFDVFFPNGNSDAVIGPMLQQFRDADFTQTAISHDAADSVTMAKDLEEATEGFLVINVSSAVRDPAFESEFREEHGDPKYGIAFAGFAHDAVQVIAKGIASGAKDAMMLRDWLSVMPPYSGVVGTFTFDKHGDVVGIPYVLKRFSRGRIETVRDIAVEAGAMMEKNVMEKEGMTKSAMMNKGGSAGEGMMKK